MIYKINDDYIDLDKLEFVSDIKGAEGVVPFSFNFQINGCKYDSDIDVNREEIFKTRNKLIARWKRWQTEGV